MHWALSDESVCVQECDWSEQGDPYVCLWVGPVIILRVCLCVSEYWCITLVYVIIDSRQVMYIHEDEAEL